MRGKLPRKRRLSLAEKRRTGPVARAGSPRYDASLLTPEDLHLFSEGTHLRLWERLGSHPRTVDGVAGTSFAVFAPNAASVSVIGDFNGWNEASHPLQAV
ncbi:MAG TPA: 1,4-alpha-glucan branching enzyme, partial [Thermoanaerobaculia bacterium]|nr:1,4-alpha-glucan branching enzyme [Thermoanaerobaculia bacterium]